MKEIRPCVTTFTGAAANNWEIDADSQAHKSGDTSLIASNCWDKLTQSLISEFDIKDSSADPRFTWQNFDICLMLILALMRRMTLPSLELEVLFGIIYGFYYYHYC